MFGIKVAGGLVGVMAHWPKKLIFLLYNVDFEGRGGGGLPPHYIYFLLYKQISHFYKFEF